MPMPAVAVCRWSAHSVALVTASTLEPGASTTATLAPLTMSASHPANSVTTSRAVPSIVTLGVIDCVFRPPPDSRK
jgi:hypothetical protein